MRHFEGTDINDREQFGAHPNKDKDRADINVLS